MNSEKHSMIIYSMVFVVKAERIIVVAKIYRNWSNVLLSIYLITHPRYSSILVNYMANIYFQAKLSVAYFLLCFYCAIYHTNALNLHLKVIENVALPLFLSHELHIFLLVFAFFLQDNSNFSTSVIKVTNHMH